MTVSINNATYDTCPICHEDFTNFERKDTKKVVIISCDHFYHMSCLASWFSMNENRRKDLSCCYCTQSSMPKIQYRISITLEALAACFQKIEKNPNFRSDRNVINCLTKLKPLSEALVTLINDVRLTNSSATENVTKFRDWIEANIPIKLRQTAAQVIVEICSGANTLKNLEQQVEHLATLPDNKWPKELEKSGMPVYHSVDGGELFRMRVSKKYLQAATAAYLCERIQNVPIFESHLEEVQRHYDYDSEVLDAIPCAKILQKDFSKLLRDNPISSREEMFLLLEETIKKTNIKDDLKGNTRLIINKFLFRLGALRTLTQEIDRWKNIPAERWPLIIRAIGVYVLDEDNAVKHYEKKDFVRLVNATLSSQKSSNLLKPLLVGIVICFAVKRIFNAIR